MVRAIATTLLIVVLEGRDTTATLVDRSALLVSHDVSTGAVDLLPEGQLVVSTEHYLLRIRMAILTLKLGHITLIAW